MSLGARWAGVETQIAVDSDPFAAETYLKNHNPKYGFLLSDISKVKLDPSIFKAESPVIVFGGPPCQGFSTSNQKTRSLDNPSNWLFSEFIRITKAIQPDIVIFENVRGFKETANGRILELVLSDLEKLGYYHDWAILNSADFSVPQTRHRLFIVATKQKPRTKFSDLINILKSKACVNVSEALHDLPELENGASTDRLPYRCPASSVYARRMRGGLKFSRNHLVSNNMPIVLERYKYIPMGGNWENIPLRLMNNYTDSSRCHTGIYHRLELSKPSIVIGNFRKNMLIHPQQHRGLSVREAARLQSFPDNFEFEGSIGFQQQQVGNAVPPLLAQKVFEAALGTISL